MVNPNKNSEYLCKVEQITILQNLIPWNRMSEINLNPLLNKSQVFGQNLSSLFGKTRNPIFPFMCFFKYISQNYYNYTKWNCTHLIRKNMKPKALVTISSGQTTETEHWSKSVIPDNIKEYFKMQVPETKSTSSTMSTHLTLAQNQSLFRNATVEYRLFSSLLFPFFDFRIPQNLHSKYQAGTGFLKFTHNQLPI